MKFIHAVKLGVLAVGVAWAGPAASASAKAVGGSKFRPSFGLELNLENGKVLHEQFDSVPYVDNGAVYLFNKDVMGLKLTLNQDSSFSVAYEPDTSKSDVSLAFKQDPDYGSKLGMILVITNKTNFKLNMTAAMNVPNQRSLALTSILPVKPKLKSFESWPHPIRELILLEWNGRNAKPDANSKSPN